MATVYNVNFKLCSPFCSYSEEDIKDIVINLIEKVR